MTISLRSEFAPREGRLPHLAWQPFVYRGKHPEYGYLYLIDVWTGEEFRSVVACHDEIFFDGKRQNSNRAA